MNTRLKMLLLVAVLVAASLGVNTNGQVASAGGGVTMTADSQINYSLKTAISQQLAQIDFSY